MLLDLLFGRPDKRANFDWFWGGTPWQAGRVRTQSGTRVDEYIALTYAACWCATRIIAETEASLDLFTYRRDGKDGQDTRHATDLPLYDKLLHAPNPDMDSMAFREGRTAHQVNWGNAFAEIEFERPGDPTSDLVALWPIHPSRVKPVRPGDGDDLRGYRYLVRNNDGTTVPMRANEMLHVPGVLSEDGIWGKGTVAHARESIGMGLGTERHGATSVGSGNLPRAVLFSNSPMLKDKEARASFRAEWRQTHGSPDSGELGILPGDAKLEPLSFNNRDSQFLESRVHNVREIARWYRVPVHMLGDLEKASYNSIEQLGLEFVAYSLLPWLRRWEKQISMKLIAPQDRSTVYVEHYLRGLLRGDLKSRMDAYKTALMVGIMTINEVRRLENLNSIGPAGNVHYVPLNMTTAERMESGDLPTPTGKGKAGDDKQGADEFTRSMSRLMRDQRRAAKGLSRRRKAALTVPALEGRKTGHAVSVDAVRGVLVDAFGRALTKLVKALGREMATLTDFPGWLDGLSRRSRPGAV